MASREISNIRTKCGKHFFLAPASTLPVLPILKCCNGRHRNHGNHSGGLNNHAQDQRRSYGYNEDYYAVQENLGPSTSAGQTFPSGPSASFVRPPISLGPPISSRPLTSSRPFPLLGQSCQSGPSSSFRPPTSSGLPPPGLGPNPPASRLKPSPPIATVRPISNGENARNCEDERRKYDDEDVDIENLDDSSIDDDIAQAIRNSLLDQNRVNDHCPQPSTSRNPGDDLERALQLSKKEYAEQQRKRLSKHNRIESDDDDDEGWLCARPTKKPKQMKMDRYVDHRE